MAKYGHLPIYKKALELVVFLENSVRGFSRYHKYSIGERLRGISWDLVTQIVRANNTPVKIRRDMLVKVRDKAEEINIAMAVARELQAFSNHNSYRQAARLSVDIARQSEGWLSKTHKSSSPES